MKIKNSLWLMGMLILLHAAPSWGQPVIQAGAEWLQPSQFTDLTANEVGAVCPPPAFLCTGLLEDVDLTGFTWASTTEELDQLFSSFGAPTFPGYLDTRVEEIDSAWAPDILAAFSATITFTGLDGLRMKLPVFNGVPLGAFPCSNIDVAYVDDRSSGNEDALIYEGNDTSCGDVTASEGYLFYRPLPPVEREAKAVPVDSNWALVLLTTSLMVFGGLMVRRNHW